MGKLNMLQCIILPIMASLFQIAAAQQTTIYVQERFQTKNDDTLSSLGILSRQIPPLLKISLERSKTLNVDAMCVSSYDRIQEKSDLTYFVEGSCTEDGGILHVDGVVLSVLTGKMEFGIGFTTGMAGDEDRAEAKVIAEEVAEDLLEDIVTGFTNSVRIVVVTFRQTGGSGKYKFLEEAIPAMLVTNLAVSPKLTLIEVSDTSIYEHEIAKESHAAMYDARTVLDIGKLMIANYAIMGGFWEHDSQLRIDVRCMSVATGEIVASKGVIVRDMDVGRLNVEISKLSVSIRTGILQDLMKKEPGTSVAVVGNPPIPNTEENRIRAGFLIEGLAQKLKIALNNIGSMVKDEAMKKKKTGDTWIKQQRDKVELFLNQPADAWTMAVELEADRLVIVQYEDYGEGDIGISVDVFDHENPSNSIASVVEYGDSRRVTDMSNRIVRSLLGRLTNVADTSVIKQAVMDASDISVRRLLNAHGVGFSFSRIITDGDGPLEYSENSSFMVSFSFPVPLRSEMLRSSFRLAPIITWDWGNNTLENLFQNKSDVSVHAISGFLSVVYNLMPERGTNPYVGIGFGFLWLRRIYGPDFNFFHAPGQILPGYTVMLGCEFRLNSKLDFEIPVKYYHTAWGQFKEEIHDGRHFNGGPLWGLNFGIGVKCNW